MHPDGSNVANEALLCHELAAAWWHDLIFAELDARWFGCAFKENTVSGGKVS